MTSVFVVVCVLGERGLREGWVWSFSLYLMLVRGVGFTNFCHPLAALVLLKNLGVRLCIFVDICVSRKAASMCFGERYKQN